MAGTRGGRRGAGPKPPWTVCQRMSDYPDDCVRYFVLATMTAVLALCFNLLYPLLSKSFWS
uniref:CASP-like protein n=1 Tax=Cynoglossus semilaevis TaxID=244447 RepID=A0A3P8UUE9_CYNSE